MPLQPREPTPYRMVSLTEFRRNASELTNWVSYRGGRVWLLKHRRVVATVVCNSDAEKLDKWDGRSLDEQKRRMQILWRRWEAVKSGEMLPDLPSTFWE